MTVEPANIDTEKHPEILQGRKTGSEQWRRERGELGTCAVGPTELQAEMIMDGCVYKMATCMLLVGFHTKTFS